MIDRGNYSTSALLGLQLDLPHAGATYAPRFASPAIDAQDLWRIRGSSQRWPALRLPVRPAALIDLGKALVRVQPSPLALVFGHAVRAALARPLAAFSRL